MKQDALNGMALAGAVFELQQNAITVATATSDIYGQVNFCVPPGTYTMYETVAPDGYLPNNSVYTVVVDAGCNTTINGVAARDFVVANQPGTTEQTPAPTIGAVSTASTAVTGTGIAGCSVTVTWPDLLTSTVTVGMGGIWSAPTAGHTLTVGQVIYAYQTCPNMLPSNAVSTVIQPPVV